MTRAGKCKHQEDGHITLPDSSLVPRDLPGTNTKEQIDVIVSHPEATGASASTGSDRVWATTADCARLGATGQRHGALAGRHVARWGRRAHVARDP